MSDERKIPIEEQVAVTERMIKELWGVLSKADKDAALGTRKFLIWCKDNPDILRAAAMIYKDDAVRKVREAFPEAKVTIRQVGTSAEDSDSEVIDD